MPGRDSQSKITHREAQAVRHMEQLMSSNLRSFGIGILVENDNMRIWYGDRMGLIVTREFKWLQDEDLTFLRCVAAMGHPDVHGLGILSGVQFSGMALHEYELSHLSIAARRPDALQAEKLEFALAVKDPHVYSEFGVVGRGTTVLAVVAKPDTKAHQLYKDEELVAKISWLHKAHQAEDALIKAVRRGLKDKKPQYLPNIVDLKCSVTRSMSEIKLPRTSHILHRDLSINNIMWYRIGDKLIAVLCDWDLAERQINGPASSLVPHDTQATPPDVPMDAELQADDDAAQPAESEVRPRYRTGTGPFMAMDLLRDGPPPPHLYRYDLESLFYILICVCAVLDLQKKKFGRLLVWEQESLSDIGMHKRDFLLGTNREYDSFFKGSDDSAFKSLFVGKDSWAHQLWLRFSMVEFAYAAIVGAEKLLDGAEKAEARSTEVSQDEDEDEILPNLDQLRAKREKLISYARFMKILGAPQDGSA
ncbi:hypothetical protein C8Q72DRAFT_771988 [Fomitopsis betulina]|nr:hypothetical protein C8Q72DRAFT_771988 [Fomitopsis betulina]